jgi:type IV secretory pathway VirD2 relaxase
VRAGHTDIAEATARRALLAEPGNADALVALLAARDLLGKADATELPPLPKERTALSPLGRELMSELLARRAGPAAARAFADAAHE